MSTNEESTDAARRLVQRLRSDGELRGKVNAAQSYEDFVRIARDAGFDLGPLSEAEACELAARESQSTGELSPDELSAVAGGCRKAGGEQEVYLKYEFKTVFVTS